MQLTRQHNGDMRARLLAIVVLLGAVIAALSGLTGEAASCLARAACDCETIHGGAIAQPANAWSALALGGVGVWFVGRRPTGLFGAAIVAASIGSMWHHASITAWAARVDAGGIAAVAGAVALTALGTEHRRDFVLGFAIATIGLAWAGAGQTASVVFGGIAAAGLYTRRATRHAGLLVGSLAAFAAGSALWLVGRSGGLLCSPDAFVGAHAVWHVVAAGGLVLLGLHLESGSTPGGDLRSLTREITT